MHWDAPIQLLRALAADLLRRPGWCRQMLRHYLDLRSLACGTGRLPTRSIFDLLPDAATTPVILEDQFEIPLLPVGPLHPHETSSTTLREAVCLALLLKSTRARTIVEFGTSYGDTAVLLAANSPSDATVHTTDHPERPEVGIKIRASRHERKIVQAYAKTGDWDLDRLRGRVDFLFIDASHAYADVLADSERALELIAPGGVVCWHDYRFQFRHDVVRALDELSGRIPLQHVKYTSLAVHRPDASRTQDDL